MIQVELSEAEAPIEPGGTAQLSVTITNKQEHDDHVFLEIEGIDVEWYALPVPAVNVAAGESQCARVLFKIARSSECQAGTYPFLVRARGMESGVAGVQQAALIIKPFSALQMDIVPRRVTATFLRRANITEITIANLGNREETLDLYASDPEDACTYEFETSRVTLKPGHSKSVALAIEPVTRPFLGSARLYGFTVTARSVQDSYVSANANGQLERRAFLSTVAVIILLLIALGAGGWALFRPRPVMVHNFTATPMQVMAGDEVTLSWDIANFADGSHIEPDNIPIKGAFDSAKVRPQQTTTYVLVARGMKEKRREVTVVVLPRPPAPKAEISQFVSQPRRIHQGDTATLTWNVKGATLIVLNPLGIERDPALWRSQEVKPDQTTTYVLAARGAAIGVPSKSVTVEVVPANVPIAEINSFRSSRNTLVAGQKATLTWVVDGAVNIEIDNGVGGGLEPRGKFEIAPTLTTTYTLRATDNKGNIRTRQITVTVTQPEPDSPANPTPENTLPTQQPSTPQ